MNNNTPTNNHAPALPFAVLYVGIGQDAAVPDQQLDATPASAMTTFGERLRELRQSAGLTQEQLAERSGLSIWNIRNYEQSHREPYWSVVPRLASALLVSCDAFADAAAATQALDQVPPRKKKARTPRGKRK
jgi:ribosome-binding protein aMBF1 (putative translation factor)